MKTYRRKRKPEQPLTPEQQAQRKSKLYKKRLKIKKRKRVFSLCVFVALIIGAIMIFAPVFDIASIQVKGNKHVKTEDVIQTGRIFEGDNIWLFRTGSAEKRIKAFPYVKDAQVTRGFPNKVVVTVKEHTPYAYVKQAKKKYILIERGGQILQQVKKAPADLKEIRISKLASAEPGESFAPQGTLVGRTYKTLLSYLKKDGYEDGIKYIEISGDDVRFKFNNLVVIIGDTNEMEYKFAFVKTFIRERGVDVEGCFDISAPNVGGYYKENYDENEVLKTNSQKQAEEEAKQNEAEENGEQTSEE